MDNRAEGISPVGFQFDSNYSDSPLVTVNLTCHSGDIKFLERAVASVAAQDLAPSEIQLLLIFDGDPSAEEEATIEKSIEGTDFQSVFLIGTGKKTGYYCLGRNQALEHPYNFGYYQANLDADNEWLPAHLSGLLEAIRLPQGDEGWPHFVYSRREYLADNDDSEWKAPLGPSPLTEWNEENCEKLAKDPRANFVDTGDFLIGKGALYRLADVTGCIWNTNVRRFGDWELMCRMAQSGIRGHAVDQVTHLYHWVGSNLQFTRRSSDFAVLSLEEYERLKAQGAFRE